MSKPIALQLPFVWPDPRVNSGGGRHERDVALDAVAGSSRSVFGVVSGIDTSSVDWLDEWLYHHADLKLRLVVSIHPTCRTSASDLKNLLRLAGRDGDRAAFRVFPEASLLDRSSNLLCFCALDGEATIWTGPTENMGFSATSPSQGNLASAISVQCLEACRKWFDHLWGLAGELDPTLIASMPRLALPAGDDEAARLWEDYRRQCLTHESTLGVDPESGEVVLVDQNNDPLPSPTEAIGVPKLDHLASSVAHIFSLGMLVSVDKLSRIPPLEAPVKPSWFGVESFRQRGMVSAQTSMKVAPFDESTLKKFDRLRKVSGEVLPRFSYALADGVRWMPKQAIPLFEEALTAANDEAKEVLFNAVGSDVKSFLDSQCERIRSDAQRMYEAYHPGGRIPDDAISSILDELKTRLDKAKAGQLIPTVAYSPIAFNASQATEWSSPWGQAFALLKGIAEFPRNAMTNSFFWRGIRANEEALVSAMNVAGDQLVAEYGGRKAMQRAELELQLIKRLEECSADAKDKCHALFALIASSDESTMVALVAAADESGVDPT